MEKEFIEKQLVDLESEYKENLARWQQCMAGQAMEDYGTAQQKLLANKAVRLEQNMGDIGRNKNRLQVLLKNVVNGEEAAKYNFMPTQESREVEDVRF